MRGISATAVGVFAVTAMAGSSNTTCAKGLYILCARGSGEAAVAPKAGTYPDNTGSPGILALKIQEQVKGSIIAGVIYPATDPTAKGTLDLPSYYSSENKGAKAIVEEINSYHSACPDSQIALIGYSQGAQIVQDALCGGTGGNFNSDAPLPADLVEKNVLAIALIADPTHIANTTYDHGTSVHDGVFPRKNTTACDKYSNLMGSWCGANDRFCDSGTDDQEHAFAAFTFETDVVKFVVGKWNNSTSKGDSGSTATTSATTNSSATKTSAASVSSTQSDKPSSTSGLNLYWSLLLGAGMVLVTMSL